MAWVQLLLLAKSITDVKMSHTDKNTFHFKLMFNN